MSKAIKIKLTKAPAEYDLGASKFFGDPTVPSEWVDRFAEHIGFIGQIRLSDIADLDPENRLPHTGYLYFFADTEVYPFDIWVNYYDGEPDTVIDSFNENEWRFDHLTEAFLATFEECKENENCTRLFGTPSFEHEDKAPLLLQYDPIDNKTGFLDDIDGYAYIFFDTNDLGDSGTAHLWIERT